MGLAGGLATNGTIGGGITAASLNWGPTGSLVENAPRGLVGLATITATTGGTLRMFAGPIVTAGQAYTNVNIMAGTTAGTTLTASFCGVYTQALGLLASTVNVTSAGWTASTIRTWQFATTLNGSTGGTWTPSTTQPTYIGLVVIGSGTQPTFTGVGTAALPGGLAPIMCANTTDTGLTFGNLPTTTAALGSSIVGIPYCYLS